MAQFHEMTGDEPSLRRRHEKQRHGREMAFPEAEAQQGEPEEQDPDEGVGAVHSR